MSTKLVEQIKRNTNKNPFGEFPTLFPCWWDFITEGFEGVTLLDMTEISDEQMKNRRQRLLVQRSFEIFKPKSGLFICVIRSRENYNIICLFQYDDHHIETPNFSFDCKCLKEDEYFDYLEGDDCLDVEKCLISYGGIHLGNLTPEFNAPNNLLKKWGLFDGCIVGCVYEHMSDHPKKSRDEEGLILFLRNLIPIDEQFAFFTFVQEPGAYIEMYYFILKKNK
jgi:hypothetical protein